MIFTTYRRAPQEADAWNVFKLILHVQKLVPECHLRQTGAFPYYFKGTAPVVSSPINL